MYFIIGVLCVVFAFAFVSKVKEKKLNKKRMEDMERHRKMKQISSI